MEMREDLRQVRNSSWSQGQQACEDALEQYEQDYADALSELRDDYFDAQLDSLDEAYEEALHGGEYEQDEIDRLYWEELEDLFAECLELGRDSSADEEKEVEAFPEEEEEEEEEEEDP